MKITDDPSDLWGTWLKGTWDVNHCARACVTVLFDWTFEIYTDFRRLLTGKPSSMFLPEYLRNGTKEMFSCFEIAFNKNLMFENGDINFYFILVPNDWLCLLCLGTGL